jgi:aspartate carbamoyltransferase catalytic subunit
MNFIGSHITSIDQFTRADVERLCAVALRMEPYATRQKTTQVLRGAVLANLFFEPSTRTRISFHAAFSRLGGSVCDTTGFQFSSMAKGESLYDTARVIAGYADVIVIRHPVEGSVREFAEAVHVPVINGGDGPGEHPTQALLDLYTIQKEFASATLETIDELKIAMAGDLKHGRTVHSLTKLLSLFKNVTFVFASPPELRMPGEIVEQIRKRGHTVQETDDLGKAVQDVKVVYMTRIQQERFASEEEANKFRGTFCINQKFYEKHCVPGTILMHPLPRDSRPGANELNNDLNPNPKLAVFRQADNGIPIRMALFALVLGVEEKIEASDDTVSWHVPRTFGRYNN